MSPLLAFGAAKLKTGNKSRSGVPPESGVPSAENRGAEVLMEGPGRLITEETASGDPRGDFSHKGHMVGSVTRDGRKGGRGEAAFPSVINEDSVEPD
jgi:hypothetical protein